MKEILFGGGLLVLSALFMWPRFSDYDRYVLEGGAKGKLSEMRHRASLAKKDGRQPKLEDLGAAPALWDGSLFFRKPHRATSAIVETTVAAARDTGGWGWDEKAGHVFIDCTHTDSKLSVWTAY